MHVKRICAYCGKYLGSKEVANTANPKLNITHGICPECFQKIMCDLEEVPPEKQQPATKTKGGPSNE